MTVLFADVRGSMELLADRDPEEARKLLDPVLQQMMDAVHRYEGQVNQVMGDGIMALFGAPVAHEDHAVRACYAALAMQRAIRRYTEDVRRSHGVEVQVRIGLNSGGVLVRAIGSDLRMDYTAVGQTVHLAARMEQLATPGTIRLTADTLRLAEGFVQVTGLGPVPVKGLAEPIEVFELLGTAGARTRLQAAAARGLTRFVGRDLELDQLRQALERSRAGHGQVVAVVGEPGVGKSRLFWELVHSHRTEGWLVLESSSVSYGKATPYLPLTALLRAYVGIDPGDDGRKIREKTTGKVLTLDEGLRPTLPAVFALLDAGGPEHPNSPPRDPGQGGERIVEAVKRLLLRESLIQPLVLVFEDLQWVDAATQACLEVLVESLPTARVLLLLNYRPEYQHPWGGRTYYSQLRLDPLPAVRAEEMLSTLLGADPALGPLRRLLIERTEGTPFFIEESVRTLVETGVLSGERGAYRLARPVDSVQVPATVQALLAARIDRLEADDKTLLQTAAVVGHTVPFGLLHRVAGLSEDAVRAGLARLQAAEFLYEAALFPELEYTFKHALTFEVAYGSLIQERRRALHARVVEAFEELAPQHVEERAAWLVHHAFRGEVWTKAVAYLRHSLSVPAPSLDAVVGGPESPGYLWWTANYERAVRAGRRDFAIGADFGNFGLSVVSAFRLGQAYHSLGAYPEAITFLRRVLDLLDGELTAERFGMAGLPAVFARAWMACCLAERGDFSEAVRLGEEAVQIAEDADRGYSFAVACVGLGTARLVQGVPAPAAAILERGLVVAEVGEMPLLFPLLAAPLGAAYALAGKATEAVDVLERAVERAQATRWLANEALRLGWLADASLRTGARDRAATLADQAIALARERGERGHEAYALAIAGEVAGGAPARDASVADERFQGALQLAQALGMQPLVARCHLGIGRLYRGSRRAEEARPHLDTAVSRCRQMDMPFWLEQAEAE